MVVLRRKIYEMLRKEDFRCPCCGRNDMDEETLWMLDNAMSIAGFRFEINSGFRCLTHNRELNSKDTSSHLKGVAADIRIINHWYQYKIVNSLILVGFERINLKKSESFLHVDNDKEKPREILWID